MWRLALAAVPVLVLALALAGGVASQTDTPTPTPESSPSTSPSPSSSPSPSPTAPTPGPLPPPPPPTPIDPNAGQPQPPAIDPAYPGTLRPGDWVQITGTDSCLNMRWEPRMPAPGPDGALHDNVLNCLSDGFVGRLDGGAWGGYPTLPVSADGRWWWHLVGQGWAAEEFLTLHHQGGIPWPPRPDLANSGLIAYIGKDNGIWLMNADGSEQRPIVAGEANQWLQTVQWSPQGDRLAFSASRADGTHATRVIGLDGNVLTEIPGLSEARWSPSGGRLAGVRSKGAAGGYQAAPVVFDLPTGVEWPIGPATQGNAPPAWSPDGNTLAFICASGYIGQPDGTTVIDETSNCHGDGLRVVSVDGSNPRTLLPVVPQYYWSLWSPAWSPSGQTISVTSMQEGGCMGYALVDVASGAITGCDSSPNVSLASRGGCGSPGMSASTWTQDGRLVFFVPGAGQTGLFVHDPVTGASSFIPNMNAGKASLAQDGSNLTFDGGRYIWVAGLDGSNLTLLAEGHSPAWQPVP